MLEGGGPLHGVGSTAWVQVERPERAQNVSWREPDVGFTFVTRRLMLRHARQGVGLLIRTGSSVCSSKKLHAGVRTLMVVASPAV